MSLLFKASHLRLSGRTRQGWNGKNILWAEALSCQMEYKYLAHLTGRTHYYDKVNISECG